MNSVLEKLTALVPEDKRDVFAAGAGMLALLGGRKIVAMALFGSGMAGLEKKWRERHPDFSGSLEERWAEALKFYEATHQEPTNRKLHIIGIPMIVGGTVGLLIFQPFRPLWGLSATAFVGGWVLNFIGHGKYEKKAPAFADDPLSFIAGPVWDFRELVKNRRAAAEARSEAAAPGWTQAPASA
jgi:hypothetical protein